MPGPPQVNDDGFMYPACRRHASATGARVPHVRHLAFQANLLLVLKTSARKAIYQGFNV